VTGDTLVKNCLM